MHARSIVPPLELECFCFDVCLFVFFLLAQNLAGRSSLYQSSCPLARLVFRVSAGVGLIESWRAQESEKVSLGFFLLMLMAATSLSVAHFKCFAAAITNSTATALLALKSIACPYECPKRDIKKNLPNHLQNVIAHKTTFYWHCSTRGTLIL